MPRRRLICELFMNLLFKLYAVSYPMIAAIPEGSDDRDRVERLRMLISSFITTLCAGGVAFYLRYLVALCKEWKPRRLHFRKPPQLRMEKKSTIYRLRTKPRPSRAALHITEIPLNTTFNELRRDRA